MPGPSDDEIHAIEDRRRELRRRQAIEEQEHEAWYVTLVGALFGWFGPLSKLTQERARRRNAERPNARCSDCGGKVATAWDHCPHCGVAFVKPD